MDWSQNYNPLNNVLLSTAMAAMPIVILLALIALVKIRIHYAALIALGVAWIIAVFGYSMPASQAAATTVFGAMFGLFPIGWIILNLIFLYTLTVEKGLFNALRNSLVQLTPDPRVQVILIAFSFGAFFEGAAGFGTPVAVTGAILIQLGFKPLQACGLSLIANTAPVAFGALGTPIITLSSVTDLDVLKLSAMAGRQLPIFSVIVPFWVVFALAGWRRTWEVWPAALVAGLSFAVPQFLISNFHGPWLVDIVSAICSMAALAVLLRFWRPREVFRLGTGKDSNATALPIDASVPQRNAEILTTSASPSEAPPVVASGMQVDSGKSRPREIFNAWLPWIILSVLVFIWGIPQLKKALDSVSNPKLEIPYLHKKVYRVPPVAEIPKAEDAIFKFNWLSATGTGILAAAVLSGFLMGYKSKELLRIYGQTLVKVRFSLITIAAMLALGFVTKYSGTDATLGLALAMTGFFYPFFGTLLGWLGVALTGSDTASNVLFGGLQKITATELGISPILMASANSTGGVMGKMVDAQSIVVASTATGFYGHEGAILRYVFWHSIILACLVGLLVFLQAYVFPFTEMVVK